MGGNREAKIDERTLDPEESWTYAKIRMDWQEKEVLVYFESGVRISDLAEPSFYVVRARSAHDSQEWYCESHPIRRGDNVIEWDAEASEILPWTPSPAEESQEEDDDEQKEEEEEEDTEEDDDEAKEEKEDAEENEEDSE